MKFFRFSRGFGGPQDTAPRAHAARGPYVVHPWHM